MPSALVVGGRGVAVQGASLRKEPTNTDAVGKVMSGSSDANATTVSVASLSTQLAPAPTSAIVPAHAPASVTFTEPRVPEAHRPIRRIPPRDIARLEPRARVFRVKVDAEARREPRRRQIRIDDDQGLAERRGARLIEDAGSECRGQGDCKQHPASSACRLRSELPERELGDAHHHFTGSVQPRLPPLTWARSGAGRVAR